MPRYIDADALRERVLYRKKPRNHMDDEAGAYDRGFNAGIFAASKEIDSAPTVSPDEVRGVGEWIKREKVRPNLPDDSDYEFECSCCGWRDLHNAKMIVPYCWHCGAKMEVSEDA